MSDLSHLRVEGTARSVRYTHPGAGGGGPFRLPPRDRVPHARRLRQELEAAEEEARTLRRQAGEEEEGAGEVIAVRSDRDFELKADSLERRTSGIELLSVKQEEGVTVAKVFVPRGKHVRLLSLIDAYAAEQGRGGRPKNRQLVESIASIKLAAIRDFWQDAIPLPPAERSIWWEVWLRAGQEDADVTHRRFAEMARRQELRVSDQFVRFPERVVVQAYGTQQQLGRSVDLLALIAELRQAKELATAYDELAPREQREFVDDALRRLVVPRDGAPAVCLLDTGVNREHPLIAPGLAAADTQAVKPEWGSADDRRHGTGMAGIALYGCLTKVLSSNDPITLRHRLESVKILPPPPSENDPRDWGPFTVQAVSLAELQAPARRRAICMAITADDRDQGVPSLWSADVDQMCSGALGDGQRLMFISAGNLEGPFDDQGYVYHRTNCEYGVEDPGQSWNALTIGAFTEKVFIQDPTFAGWHPMAPSGDLCPKSRTSLPWDDAWPVKPDVVMEGGNYARRGTDKSECEDLSLLTTTFEGGRLLKITHDTSPATADAARMAAGLWSYYPRLRPETIRALMVHSARWTPAMLQRIPGNNKADVQRRLRCYGYGVPDFRRAIWSAENAVTLIYEGEIQPYAKDPGADVRTDEMHLHGLPWPVGVLQGLGETDVSMRVTLSYFVEPSPGRRGWKEKHRYQSHGLRFDVIRPTEDVDGFVQRLSRALWDDPTHRPRIAAESRDWVIGEQGRTRGSIHSDWWQGTAAQLASCGHIAVYPVTGWWRERAHLGKWGQRARYSLIVTIEAPDVETDLYTPIATETAVTTAIETGE